MTDDPQAQPQSTEAPVKETPEAPMPSVEQKTPEPQEVKEGLPEDASERTRHEFEKVQMQLREERQRREAIESAFRAMQPKQPEVVPEPLYDPTTGILNEQVLTDVQKRTYEAEQRALHAEQAVQGYMQEVEAREAYAAHPEANPNAKEFDPELKKRASAILLHSMVNPNEYSGKQLSLKESYDYLKTSQGDEVVKAKQEAAKEAIEQLTPKEQASLEAVGSPARRTEGVNLDELRYRSRKGDKEAIIERMRRISKQE